FITCTSRGATTLSGLMPHRMVIVNRGCAARPPAVRCNPFGVKTNLFRIERLDADIAKAQVRGRVVALDAQRPFALLEPVPGVVVLLAVVGPVGHLVAVDPRRNVPPVGRDRHREPLAVRGHDLASLLPAVNGPGAEIDRLGPVVPLPLVANLRLVTLLILARDAPEEEPAIEVLAVRDALELADEIGPLTLRLQVAGAVLDVDPAFLGDRELGRDLLVLRGFELFPAGEVFAVEERLRVEWTSPKRSQVQGLARRDHKHYPPVVAQVGANGPIAFQGLLALDVFNDRLRQIRAEPALTPLGAIDAIREGEVRPASEVRVCSQCGCLATAQH